MLVVRPPVARTWIERPILLCVKSPQYKKSRIFWTVGKVQHTEWQCCRASCAQNPSDAWAFCVQHKAQLSSPARVPGGNSNTNKRQSTCFTKRFHTYQMRQISKKKVRDASTETFESSTNNRCVFSRLCRWRGKQLANGRIRRKTINISHHSCICSSQNQKCLGFHFQLPLCDRPKCSKPMTS